MNERESVIVVGVDGSDASRQALRWAAGQAELTGARLNVVRAWRQPVNYGYPAYPVGLADTDVAGQTGKELDELIAEVLGAVPAVPVTSHVVEGHPAVALVAASDGADLLVVGSRGYGAFAGMLLGSVGMHCASHANCPVVIIRESA